MVQNQQWNKEPIIIIFVMTKNKQIWLENKVARQQNPLFKGTEKNITCK